MIRLFSKEPAAKLDNTAFEALRKHSTSFNNAPLSSAFLVPHCRLKGACGWYVSFAWVTHKYSRHTGKENAASNQCDQQMRTSNDDTSAYTEDCIENGWHLMASLLALITVPITLPIFGLTATPFERAYDMRVQHGRAFIVHTQNVEFIADNIQPIRKEINKQFTSSTLRSAFKM